jgi:hypothetical protein
MNSLGRRGQGQRCKWSTGEEEWGQIVRRKVVGRVERLYLQWLRRRGHLQPLVFIHPTSTVVFIRDLESLATATVNL